MRLLIGIVVVGVLFGLTAWLIGLPLIRPLEWVWDLMAEPIPKEAHILALILLGMLIVEFQRKSTNLVGSLLAAFGVWILYLFTLPRVIDWVTYLRNSCS